MTHRPVLTHTRAELADALSRLPGTKALVMTMGASTPGTCSSCAKPANWPIT